MTRGFRACMPAFVLLATISASARCYAQDEPPVPCPGSAVVASEYVVSSVTFDKTALNAFNVLRDSAAQAVDAFPDDGPHPDTGPVFLSPDVVAEYLVKTAQEELASYLIDELVEKLCRTDHSVYFPDTCASRPSLSSGGLDAGLQIDNLRATLRSDIEALPACIIFQRSDEHSAYGYLLTSVLVQLFRDKKYDYQSLIHNLATNPLLAGECDRFPAEKNAGCQLYLATVAVDAALTVRQTQRDTTPGFTFAAAFSNPMSSNATAVARQLAGAVLANLAIARCGVTPAPGTTFPSPCTSTDAVIVYWTQMFGFWNNTAGALPESIADLARAVDAATQLDRAIAAEQRTANEIAAAAGQAATTTLHTTLGTTDKARLHALQLNILAGAASLISEGLLKFGQLSFDPSDPNQKLQIEQAVGFLSGASAAYTAFESGNYAEGVRRIRDIRDLACRQATDNSARRVAEERCGLLFRNLDDLPELELIGFAAQLSAAKDAEEFASIVRGQGSGANAWRRKQTSPMFFAGSYVGIQGGYERLSAPGYSSRGREYGLFAPLGLGYSWPDVLFDRPLSLYVSVVDLGSIISTSSGESDTDGTVSSEPKTGWSQLLAPGVYVATQLLGPVHVGVGYAYRTPALRTVTLPGGDEISADSSRVQLFFGVDVTLFSTGRR